MRINTICIRSHNVIQDLVTIPLCLCLGHEGSVRPSMDTLPHTITDPPPLKIVLHEVTLGVSFSLTSTYSHTSVTTRNQQSAFICKENGSPVSKPPMLVFLPKLQTRSRCAAVSSGHRAGLLLLKPESCNRFANCLVTNADSCRLLVIILKSSSRRPTITTCHVPEITILTRCCGSPTSLSGSSPVPSGLFESYP